MREYKDHESWNRCDICGRFISISDLDSGKANRRMVTPDTSFSAETYETLCRKHYAPNNKTKMKTSIPLVVTTEHKGVFFGYGLPTENKTIRLEKVRMAVYWSSDVKGVVGLASTGPTAGCKIGPPAPAMTLQGVTSVMEASIDATDAWEKGPWA